MGESKSQLRTLDVPLMRVVGWLFSRLSPPAQMWLAATLSWAIDEGRLRAHYEWLRAAGYADYEARAIAYEEPEWLKR